jgi:pimeloyl-ACP methyl ester carboxylesterase
LVLKELGARGYSGVTVDWLPHTNEGPEKWADIVAEAVMSLQGKVTVVGHSAGGLILPLIRARVAVDELAFVSAPLPIPGLSHVQWLTQDSHRDMYVAGSLKSLLARDSDDPETSRAVAIEFFYHDVSPDLAAWALDNLRTQETSEELHRIFPRFTWPADVRLRYVYGRRDRIINPDWVRREVPRLLGIAPLELDTGHSSMLAKPAELVDSLFEEVPAAASRS